MLVLLGERGRRFSADCIVLMDTGRMVEVGSHAELVARGGRYANLIERQRLVL